jgi:hypothetical protein
MHHVHLAATTLVFLGANVMAQEIERDDPKRLAPDASFAYASGMEIRGAGSPLGSLAFGRVPPPRAEGDGVPAVAPRDGSQDLDFRAEDVRGGDLNHSRPVPEPPPFVMLLAGLGALGVVISRRH